MARKRIEATKEILDRLKSGPAFPKQISDELRIPLSTVYYNLRKTLPKLGLIKQLDDGKYAIIEFSPEGEKVKEAHDRMKRKLFRSPKPEEMAYVLGEPPAKVRDLLYHHVPSYSEPTTEEIKRSNKKLWIVLNTGLDLPDGNALIRDGIKQIKIYGEVEEDILIANYRRHTKGVYFDRVRFNRSRSYLREFTDMAPKISTERKDDWLFITIDWRGLPISLPLLSRSNPNGHTEYIIKLIKDEQEIAGLDQILDYKKEPTF